MLAFEHLLAAAEAEVQAHETAKHAQLPPGRIRPPKSGTGLDAEIGSSRAVRTSVPTLQLDLRSISSSEQMRTADAMEPLQVQEEVDFWVQSARSDVEGRRTYRELVELEGQNPSARRHNVVQDNKKSPKLAPSPVGRSPVFAFTREAGDMAPDGGDDSEAQAKWSRHTQGSQPSVSPIASPSRSPSGQIGLDPLDPSGSTNFQSGQRGPFLFFG